MNEKIITYFIYINSQFHIFLALIRVALVSEIQI